MSAIVLKVCRAVIARCRRLFWDDDFGITVAGVVVSHVAFWLVGMGALWLLVVR